MLLANDRIHCFSGGQRPLASSLDRLYRRGHSSRATPDVASSAQLAIAARSRASTMALRAERASSRSAATLDAIDQAIPSVSASRAALGATENRLESQIRSQNIAIENTVRANSQIRDTDFAKETSELLRNQILKKVNISLRAQANVNTSVALKLLA